jgi:retron-type reverse transcriptase
MFGTKSTTVPITKEMVKEAYRKVKSNQGSAGVDKESLEVFQTDLLNNLYKLWNRLSSGSYFPKPVREV